MILSIPIIFRIFFAAVLLIGVFFETGVFTVIALGLIFAGMEAHLQILGHVKSYSERARK